MIQETDTTRLGQARDSFARADYLTACDHALACVNAHPDDAEAWHLAILSLARSGATDEAFRLLDRLPAGLAVDEEEFGALRARLFKDRYFACAEADKQGEFGRRARDAYRNCYETTRGWFSGINAATLTLLLGEAEQARELARRVLAACEQEPDTSYWLLATEAEALLLLGRAEEAADRLRRAAPLGGPADHNTTFKQLSRICRRLQMDDAILDPIRPATVIHYTGHMIHGIGRTPGIRPEDEQALSRRIRDLLERERVGFVYGSLACGTDLMVVEHAQDLGAESHVILPCCAEEFKRRSVQPAGAAWNERFDRALERATGVTELAQAIDHDEELLYSTTSAVAMGAARLKAAGLEAEVFQLAVFNGRNAESAAGTAADVARWRGTGLRAALLSLSGAEFAAGVPDESATPPPPPGGNRQLRGILFADVKNFSQVPEHRMSRLMSSWLQGLADLRDRHAPHVLHAETWGDAVYFVTDDVHHAADLCLELARMLEHEHDEEHQLQLRVSAHAGLVYAAENPVLRSPAFFGPDVVLAARMEPCAPPGEVYVTERFAALLALSSAPFTCQYVGMRNLPKDYGAVRMYHLTRKEEGCGL